MIIAKAGKPVVKLVPIEPPVAPIRKLGGWNGKFWMADDFDAELEDFAEYMPSAPPAGTDRTPD